MLLSMLGALLLQTRTNLDHASAISSAGPIPPVGSAFRGTPRSAC